MLWDTAQALAIFCEHNLKNNGPPVFHIRIWYTGRQRGIERLAQMRGREENKCETNVWTNTKEIQQEIWQENTVVWKAQMRGREKSSSTAALSALVRGWSMRKCEVTCRAGQFCAELSTFNENFCHNLPWKKNSPLSGPSFSQLTTKWVGEPD